MCTENLGYVAEASTGYVACGVAGGVSDILCSGVLEASATPRDLSRHPSGLDSNIGC
jgi:hypothetical protein